MKGRELVLIVILLGFGLRLWGLSSQPIWWDEARNIVVASRPLREIPTSGELDIHPPLYFFLLHFWMRLGGWQSPYSAVTLDESGIPHDQSFAFFLRFLSVIFGTLSLPLCFTLGRKLGGQALALVAVIALSLAPFWLLEAQQIRMYTVMLVFLLASGATLWKGVQEEKAWPFAAFGISAALSLLTHYSAFWVLVGWGVFLVPWALRRGLRGLSLAGLALVVTVVIFSPQLPRALSQTLGYANPNLTVPTFPSFLRELLGALGAHPEVTGILAAAGAFGLLLFGMQREALFLLSWLVVSTVLYYTSFFQKGGAFEPRYIAGISPALYILIGAISRYHQKLRWALGLAVAGLFLGGFLKEAHTPSFIREDSRALVSYLYSRTTPADVIITDAPFPLNLYWPGFSPDQKSFARAHYLFADFYTLPETLSKITEGKEHAVLIHWFKSDADPRGLVKLLLDKHGELLEEISFTGYQVWRYRLPEGKIPFSLTPSPEKVEVKFGDGLTLEQTDWGGREPNPVSLSPDLVSVAPGHRIWVALYWHLSYPTNEPLKVAGYLRDERGLTLSQDDRWLLNDRHLRTPFWENGNRSWVFLSIPVPPGTLPGRYWLHIAVYGENSGRRIPILDQAGNPAGTELKLGEVEILKPLRPFLPSELKIPFPFRVEWGNIVFLGHGGIPSELASGQPLLLKSFWEAPVSGGSGFVEFILLDDGGKPAIRWEKALRGAAESKGAWWEWIELQIPPDISPGRYRLALGERTFLGEITIKGRPHLFSPPSISTPLEIAFGRGIVLKGYEIHWHRDSLEVTLLWQCRERIAESYTVFTHILDAEGRYLAGHDSPPDGGKAPTNSWLPGEFILDVHEIPLPSGFKDGRYFLEIGLYDPSVEGLPRLHTLDGKDSVLLPLNP